MGCRLRVVPHPITSVDTAAQMFGKVTVDMAADPCCPLLGFDYDSVHGTTPLILKSGKH
jgi:hypothetical protein